MSILVAWERANTPSIVLPRPLDLNQTEHPVEEEHDGPEDAAVGHPRRAGDDGASARARARGQDGATAKAKGLDEVHGTSLPPGRKAGATGASFGDLAVQAPSG
ncbi:MAG: hypothetical protein ACE5HU_00315 [Acidobacteriota bacterium]